MKNFFRAFLYALQGIRIAIAERNFRIQAVIGIAAIALAFILGISYVEKLIIVLCMGLVLGAEAINSATERLLDFVSQEYREEIHEIKDLMAGAVLIFSITAFAIGLWIFTKALFFRQ